MSLYSLVPHLRRPALAGAVSVLLALTAPSGSAQDHGHLDIGAASTNAGSPLVWPGTPYFTTSSGYVKTLVATNAGKYAGYYQGNITLTVLPATPAYGGPVDGAPALGSLIFARLSLISAPPGGRFGFWDTNTTAATGPSIVLAAGETAANLFRVTQESGLPGVDPFGHIHGRRFTATQPGFYQVAFQAVDLSTNGPGGGPIHAPSPVLPVWFQAGLSMHSAVPLPSSGGVRVRFGAPVGTSLQLEYTPTLGSTNWLPVGSVVTGQDYLVDILHEGEAGAQRYYRLRRILP
ncbi:MAG: hypothetical protein RJA22_2708 [Verrucomicrobiota bacterium]|jgi:hypothetical protein